MGKLKKKSSKSKTLIRKANNTIQELNEPEEELSVAELQECAADSSLNDEGNVDVEFEEETANTSSELAACNNIEKPAMAKKSSAPNPKRQSLPAALNVSSNNNARKSKKRRDSGTSSEEERWLSAIESGKLEQVEDVELKKIKDPKLMTARQRAIYDRNNDNDTSMSGFAESLMALPIGYKEKEKPQTAEEIQKAQLKSQKRKQMADEKREKDKKKTMERLLKKQETKQRSTNKPKYAKGQQPVIRYRHTLESGATIQMPPGYDFPLKPQTAKEPPKVILCAIAGCNKRKVYNCSKTNLPLCSYECYRKNVLSLKDIMC